MSELPDDLAWLGAELEAAAARSVRRRARRQALVNGIGTVLIAAPLALAVSAAELAPDGRSHVSPAVPAEPSRTVRFVHHETPPVMPIFVPAGRI